MIIDSLLGATIQEAYASKSGELREKPSGHWEYVLIKGLRALTTTWSTSYPVFLQVYWAL